ncbi:hypothetical protein [Edaphobacter sp. HDX4]|uniref:hypothetical protein n=1 Tax=Edaphobacter sp. HDX4 TaxID=2794064 RepID=UPI002FE5DC88
MASTLQVLARAGASSVEASAVFSDAGIYQAILNSEYTRFTAIADDLADRFVRDQIELVASDANEGFNPTHDLCREITYAAVEKVRLLTGRIIPHYEFCLTEWEQELLLAHDDRCVHTTLSDTILAEKIDASRAYRELLDEVEQALAVGGPEYFRVECLKRVEGWASIDACKPLYERWGEQRVVEGKYKFVLRFREHILPIFLALRAHVEVTTADSTQMESLSCSA